MGGRGRGGLGHGRAGGGGRKTAGKIRGGGVGNERKTRVVPNFLRWRVPELTPNTPGPAACGD